MNLRYLVPALGILALTATSARAEDKAPVVTFGGWVDTILYVTDDNTTNAPATAKDESAAAVRFYAAAALKAQWTVSESLVAKTNIWFYPDGGATNNNVQVREAYVTYALNETFSWQLGKYIDHIGWISADPIGLFTINNSLIGYLGAYGNDVIGTALNITPNKGKDFSAQIHITNGYFTGSDALNGATPNGSVPVPAATNTHRENSDLGFGVDLTWNLPNEMGNVDFDFAYDMHSDQGGAATAGFLGGDVLLAGLNATIKPTKRLMFGAEILTMKMSESENLVGVGQKDGTDRLQGLLMANYKIREEGVPVSVTAMVQYVEIKFDSVLAPEKEKRMEIVGALLTNPLGTDRFGLNLEVAYWTVDNKNGSAATIDDANGISISVEAIAFF